jgi:hypothetical protein
MNGWAKVSRLDVFRHPLPVPFIVERAGAGRSAGLTLGIRYPMLRRDTTDGPHGLQTYKGSRPW